jgi:O-antigen ligase
MTRDRTGSALTAVGIIVGCLGAGYLAMTRPGYLSNEQYLGALVLLQIVLVALWNFRSRFFVLIVISFLLAGIDIPGRGAWIAARWFVLIVGALAGYLAYMKEREHRFGAFHLVAFFCVVAATVSAVVSSYPTQALMKASSLLLLFLYGASGMRLAVLGRERRFILSFLLGCEILTYITGVCYFLAGLHFFGNPNSLGAVAGVVLAPTLLWGVFISEDLMQRRRRTFALMLAVLLLLSSYARAGMLAAFLSCGLMCLMLRQYRFLIKGVAFLFIAAIFVAILLPPPESESTSVVSTFLFKGKSETNILGSRKSPWDQTVSEVKQNPFFGTGYGTSATSYDFTTENLQYISLDETSREHGDSYLEIVEWVGLLGVVPFYALVLIVLLNARRVLVWMRRTGNQFSLAVPLTAIMVAGVVHAAFEDWLFAVGYYLSVVFWALAFVLVDVLPQPVAKTVEADRLRNGRSLDPFGLILPRR